MLYIDLLRELITQFGKFFTDHLTSIQKVLLNHLTISSPKRSIECLSQLASVSSNIIFSDLMEELIEKIINEKNIINLKIHIEAVSMICAKSGHNFGNFLHQLIPLIVKYCKEEKYEEEDELREICLQCIEILIARFPNEISNYFDTFLQLCSELIKFDPNRFDDDEIEDESELSSDSEYFSDSLSDDEFSSDSDGFVLSDIEYSDSDDLSWKVRKASAKCLIKLILTRPDEIKLLYESVFKLIISIREHDKNVFIQLFEILYLLYEQTNLNELKLSDQKFIKELIDSNIDKQLKFICNEPKSTTLQISVFSFKLLSKLCRLFPNSSSKKLDYFIGKIDFILKDKNKNINIRVEALNCLLTIFETQKVDKIFNYIKQFSTQILKIIKIENSLQQEEETMQQQRQQQQQSQQQQQIILKGLKLCQQIIVIIRTTINLTNNQNEEFYKEITEQIYKITFNNIKQNIVDLFIKQECILTLSKLIVFVSCYLNNDTINICFDTLLEFLKKDQTKLITLKAFSEIANSKDNFPMNSILNELIFELSSLLRNKKNNLKRLSLITLHFLFDNHYSKIDEKVENNLFNHLTLLISEDDRNLVDLSIQLVSSILKQNNENISYVLPTILPKIIQFVPKSLFQGNIVKTVLVFFQGLVQLKGQKISYEMIVDMFFQLLNKSSTEITFTNQFYISISQCIAAMTIYAPKESFLNFLTLIKKILNSNKKESDHLFCLYSLGYIGRSIDLSEQTDLSNLILTFFASPSKNIKSASSWCLGSLSLGNIIFYLPILIRTAKSKEQNDLYLILRSLREILTLIDLTDEIKVKNLKTFSNELLNLYFLHSNNPEDGIRQVISESVGRLTVIDPEMIFLQIANQLNTESELIKKTLISSLKWMIQTKNNQTATMKSSSSSSSSFSSSTFSTSSLIIDELLQKYLWKFFSPITDSNYLIRLSVLSSLNFIIHKRHYVIKKIIPKIIEGLYSETVIKTELIKETKFGKTTSVLDKGLENRKLAFDTINVILKHYNTKLKLSKLIKISINGLLDTDTDIIIISNRILSKLVKLVPNQIKQFSSKFIKPFEKILNKKIQPVFSSQQAERNDSLIFSTLKVIKLILEIPEIGKCSDFMDFFETTIKTDLSLKKKYEELNNTLDDFINN
ncbi:TIP120 domain-containing protein [Anaeramoeba flamelloides]|uniref:TIP120 domain-containing protein n=1 Tax=Anaeramoeba flamelloides TaxID=1746091 RepID=A0ABQ8YN68_9EUKA|nr:TIP120 domain-containing protein [Anaeramoeba flamelloides]